MRSLNSEGRRLRRLSGVALSSGRSTDNETQVERAEEVPQLDGAAEAGDRVGGDTRRTAGPRRLWGARDLETLYYGWRDKILEALPK